jgi:hypothetical protein
MLTQWQQATTNTLNGTINTLNGMTSKQVQYFEWYDQHTSAIL